MSKTLSCTVCGRARVAGGGSKPGPCRPCFLKRKREARAAERAQHRCKTCGKQVSGQDTNCRGCHFAQMRAKRGNTPPLTHEQKAALIAPAESWWVCPREEWAGRIASQARRHRLVPMGKVEVMEI